LVVLCKGTVAGATSIIVPVISFSTKGKMGTGGGNGHISMKVFSAWSLYVHG